MTKIKCKNCDEVIVASKERKTVFCGNCGKENPLSKNDRRCKHIIKIVSFFLLSIVLIVVFCTVIMPNYKYQNALKLMDKGEYKKAILKFDELDDYRNSSDMKIECKYLYADALIEKEEYKKAKELCNDINAFKDCSAMIKACDEGIRFNANSQSLIESEVGDTVKFGAYEQYGEVDDIEWIVLDVRKDKLFLISKYVFIDEWFDWVIEGDSKIKTGNGRDVTWETSALREWLNDEFINTAFSEKEIAMIDTVKVTGDGNPKYNTDPGDDTYDKMYLLSIEEANRYFSSNSERMCGQTITSSPYGFYGNYMRWWLRTSGYVQSFTAFVDENGNIYEHGYGANSDTIGVRPAMWIDISDLSD